MAQFQETSAAGLSVLLFLLGLLVLASPFTTWWMSVGAPWYTAWVLWALLIGLTAALARRSGHHDA
ncbi:hypothetical protein HC341_13705 [Aquisalimonas sp. 2447]|uniref:hypothetical protein n=1 Tax=Aquisalimonas sp. 2447 TaxID=2740807 RepID=UPI00143276CA|nr:hypothetical protein [Aquisalimonas sp. 2447]QIT56156.1 hypothetical protein HC341_13705 [Aquisalimonas sp. 2447]